MVHEFRVVAVPNNAVVIHRPLVLIRGVLGDNGGIGGDGAGRAIGQSGLLA